MKYKIRKFDDTNIMRNMLLNINAHSIVAPEDYKIDLSKFNSFISALIEKGIVDCQCELPITNSERLYIKDKPLYDEWSAGYFAKQIKAVQPYVSLAITLIPIFVNLVSNS